MFTQWASQVVEREYTHARVMSQCALTRKERFAWVREATRIASIRSRIACRELRYS
jgi:hypothetical protein